jgi:hypothetical protein
MKSICQLFSTAALTGCLLGFQVVSSYGQQANNTPLSFRDIIRDDLQNARAWEIEVKAQYTLSTSSAYGDCAFSPDKTSIAYPTRDETGRTSIAIRKLEPPHELVDQVFIVGSEPQDLAWSPDGSRLAYIQNREDLHVIDIEAKKDHELPNIRVDSMQNSLVWESAEIIRAVARLEGERDKLINLDDLTSKPTSNKALIKNAHAHAKFKSPSEMQGEKFQRGDSNDDEVLLVSKDETFARRFIERAGGHGFWFTHDLRYAAKGVRNTELILFVLGVRPSPQKHFTINITVPNELVQTKSDRANFQKAQKDRLFYADVYPPKANPLNGKVIGPDYDKPLGVIRFGAWRDETVEAELTFELEGYSQYIASKDAVLTIGPPFANSPSGHHVGYPREAWFTLQSKVVK